MQKNLTIKQMSFLTIRIADGKYYGDVGNFAGIWKLLKGGDIFATLFTLFANFNVSHQSKVTRNE